MAAAPAADRTKVVIRNLPPQAQESDVRALVDEPFKDRITWFCFVQGKISTKRVVKSYALANFASPADVIEFKAAVHGHAFVTDRGVSHKCSVEYAPFQRVPKTTSKKDPREGTIEQDADFLAFVEKMQEAPVASKSILGREAVPEPDLPSKPEPKVTALMREIEARRAAKGKSLYNPKGAQRAGTGAYELVHAAYPAKESRRAAKAARAAGQGKEPEPESSARRASKEEPKPRRDRAKAEAAAQAAARAVAGDWDASKEPAEGEPVEREQKQVRMRAGFGVFAPSRVGRLLKEAKDSNDSATAVKTALQPSSRGSSTGADAPATQAQGRTTRVTTPTVMPPAASQAKSDSDPKMLAAVAEAMRTSKSAGSAKGSRSQGPASHPDRSSSMQKPGQHLVHSSQQALANGSQSSRGGQANGRQESKKDKGRKSKGDWSDEDAPSSAVGVRSGPKAVIKRAMAPG